MSAGSSSSKCSAIGSASWALTMTPPSRTPTPPPTSSARPTSVSLVSIDWPSSEPVTA
ncbi:MAG: hypothetical protein IPH80_19060 [Myxococcales bacterium]|nr:hypothetical protein [Myxococcales bacterium]